MKTPLLPFIYFHVMRLSMSAVIVYASSILVTQATEDGVTRTLDADTATTSSIVTIPSVNLQEGQQALPEQFVPTRVYTGKYGTSLNDFLTGITSDKLGNIYIAGNSMNSESSGYLQKYSPEGMLLWDMIKANVSIDGVTLDKDGNVYISGAYVTASSSSIRHSVYLEKYDGNKNLIWTKSFKAALASDPTRMIVNGIVADLRGSGSIIILFERSVWPYQTRNVFMRKYNASGAPIWEKPVGNSSPYISRPILAMDRYGKTYTAINSSSNQRWNTRISQFDAQGEPIWSTSFSETGSGFETYVHGITVDSGGNVYLVGVTKADLEGENLGFFDAFVRKYDHIGDVLWTRQFGTVANDYANSVTTDAAGNVYLAGSTSGVLKWKNFGSFDPILRIYTSNGNVLQSKQFGSAKFDISNGIRLDAVGDLYVAGHTYGNMGGLNNGEQDVFFRKFTFSR